MAILSKAVQTTFLACYRSLWFFQSNLGKDDFREIKSFLTLKKNGIVVWTVRWGVLGYDVVLPASAASAVLWGKDHCLSVFPHSKASVSSSPEPGNMSSYLTTGASHTKSRILIWGEDPRFSEWVQCLLSRGRGDQRQGSWESRSRGQRCWWQSCHLVYLSLPPVGCALCGSHTSHWCTWYKI